MDVKNPNGPGLINCKNTNINLKGYSYSADDAFISVVVLCKKAIDDLINKLGHSLTQERDIIYNEETESLQELTRTTLSRFLIHELSHATAVMGKEYQMRM